MANPGDGVGISQSVLKTTIAKWIKKMGDITVRKQVVLAMLKKKGLIKSGMTSAQIRWVFETDEHALTPMVDAQSVTFSPFEPEENAFLPLSRGYKVTDFVTRLKKLQNKGAEAMVSVYENKTKTMFRNASRRFAGELYKDGASAAGIAANRFHGLESMMAIGAQTLTDELATSNSSTYANLSTAVGGLNAAVPFTRIWTPTIVACDVNPGSGALSFATDPDVLIARMLINGQFGSNGEDAMDMVVLTKDAFEDVKNYLRTKEQIQVLRGTSLALVSMGFEALEFDGVALTWDVDVPTVDLQTGADVVHGYGLNTDKMELLLMGPGDIFKSDVTFTSKFQGDELLLWTYGNFRFESPKFFGALKNLN